MSGGSAYLRVDGRKLQGGSQKGQDLLAGLYVHIYLDKGEVLFFLLVDSIKYLHKIPLSTTADLLQLAMLLTPGVKHLFLFRHILEARSELKFHGIYRLGNRFSKFIWHDYQILIPDLLKGLCAEVSMECETTLRYALQLCLLRDMHSDMIGLKNL